MTGGAGLERFRTAACFVVVFDSRSIAVDALKMGNFEILVY